MRSSRNVASGVVLAGRTDRRSERDGRGHEPDFAVLVLDVELERGEPVALEIEIRIELPGKGCEPHRDVDTPQLDRECFRAFSRGRGQRGEIGDRLRSTVRTDEPSPDAEERNDDESRAEGAAPPQALPSPYRGPTLAKPLVRVDGWEQHRHRGWTLSQPS